MHDWKIDQMNVFVSKRDQLLSLYSVRWSWSIFEAYPFFDRFVKHTRQLDRFFFGGIDMIPSTLFTQYSDWGRNYPPPISVFLRKVGL